MDNILLAIGLLLVNSLLLVATVLQLPGNWLMVAAVGGFIMWGGEPGLFSIATLVALAIIAFLAEIIEFAAGAAGTRMSGGSRRGALWALAGSLAGGILGTFILPIPIAGSVFGACGGAFLGALFGERREGKNMRESLRSGGGAATGRLLGIVGKIGGGILIWAIATIASFWP